MTERDGSLCRVYAERERRRDENVDLLIRQLREDGISYRVRAAEALGSCGDSRVVPYLIRAAENDPETDVRFMAIRSLGKRKDPLAADPLICMLSSRDKWIRMESVKALGNIGHNSASLPVICLCNDSADQVRRAVAEALGKIWGEECRSALEMMLKDEDPYVRSAARKSLAVHDL